MGVDILAADHTNDFRSGSCKCDRNISDYNFFLGIKIVAKTILFTILKKICRWDNNILLISSIFYTDVSWLITNS